MTTRSDKPHLDAIIDRPTMPRIERLWGFLAVDNDGNEGVTGGNLGPGGTFIPFIGADEDRIKSLRPYVEQMAKMTPGVTIRFVEFTGRIDHGIVGKEN